MRFLAALLAGITASCSAGDVNTEPATSARHATIQQPNIVLIVAEDLSSRIGAYGDHLARTPNIDALATEGVLYTNAFTTAGVCAPSRAALITGQHQESTGLMHMRTSSFGRERTTPWGTFSTDGIAYEAVPPAEVKAFPEYLRRAGYVTLNNRKTDYQFGTPFTVWDRSDGDAWLEGRDPRKPFFLMLGPNDTHESRLFRPDSVVLPEQATRAERYEARFEDGFDFTSPDAVSVPPYLPDTTGVRADIARQYDNIQLLDRYVGRLMGDLRRAQLLEETIIIFTTDHGDGLPRAKRTLYDSGLQVPLIIRFPDGRYAGTRREGLVSFVDLAPTILALAGVEVPSTFHGRNIFGASPERQYIFAARDRLDEHPDRVRAIRDRRYKLIFNEVAGRAVMNPLAFRENLRSMQALREGEATGTLTPEQAFALKPNRPAEEFYDIENDPFEIHNLADDPAYADQKMRLSKALAHHRQVVGDMGLIDEKKMVLDMMWPEGRQPVTGAPLIRPAQTRDGQTIFLLSSLTGGASIGYRTCTELPCTAVWQLYTGEPVRLAEGDTLEAKAIRYGYAESTVSRYPQYSITTNQ